MTHWAKIAVTMVNVQQCSMALIDLIYT